MQTFDVLMAQMRAYAALLNEVVGNVAAVQAAARELDAPAVTAANDWAQEIRGRLSAHFRDVGAMHEQLRAPTAPTSEVLAEMLTRLRAFAPEDELPQLRTLGGQLTPQSTSRRLAGELFKTGVPRLVSAHAALAVGLEQASAAATTATEDGQTGAGTAKTAPAPPVAETTAPPASTTFPAERLPLCVRQQLETVGYRKGEMIVESHGGATVADKDTRPVLHGTPLNVKALTEGQVAHLQGKMVSAAAAYGVSPGHEIAVGDDFSPQDADFDLDAAE
jgi:hypothetical protein